MLPCGSARRRRPLTRLLLAPSAASLAAPVPAPVEAAKEKTAVPPPLPNTPAASALTMQGEHGFLELDGREYRVGGLEKTLGSDGLKVALRLKVGDRFHLGLARSGTGHGPAALRRACGRGDGRVGRTLEA